MRWKPPALGMTTSCMVPVRIGGQSLTASTKALASHGVQQFTPATATPRAAMPVTKATGSGVKAGSAGLAFRVISAITGGIPGSDRISPISHSSCGREAKVSNNKASAPAAARVSSCSR